MYFGLFCFENGKENLCILNLELLTIELMLLLDSIHTMNETYLTFNFHILFSIGCHLDIYNFTFLFMNTCMHTFDIVYKNQIVMKHIFKFFHVSDAFTFICLNIQ